ncbi:hypothetical protein [Streptomyces sp. NPDC001678]|uniref:hypothetical protein n=1 Tax=Streptomyces sp. NPDC001678 TaxID=3364599 RepID=UPI00367AC79D
MATKAGAFASDLEKVSGALSTYASEIRPLAKKLGDLKDEAVAFVASVEGDDHWRRDKKKVDHNNSLWRSVNATVAAFTDAERSCHDKIVALVGGDKLTVDDGSHKPNMYGYKASDLDHAESTPWGSMAEREYTGIAWLGHQIKSFVWDGFIVDGVWGTITGLGTLVGTDGWDKAGQAWTGLAKLATGIAITASPLGAAYWMAPEDKLPSWLRDSRTAMKETGKALVAYDQWGKNPARAAGGVTFNVLTTVFTGGSGAAAKGGAVAKTVSVLGKAGRIVDPITYVGKAGKFTFVKVGDLMSGLKNLRVGSTVHLAEETFKLPGEGAALPKRPPNLPETAVPFLADGNKVVYLEKGSSRFFDAEGKELQAATKELSADERAAKAAAERQKQPQHSTVSEREKVPVAASVHAGGDATAPAARGGGHIPAGGHTPGQASQHVPGDGHAPGGAAGHETGGAANRTGATTHTGEHSASSSGHGTPGGSDAGHASGPGHAGEPGPSGVVPVQQHPGGTGTGAGSSSHGPSGQHANPGSGGHRPWDDLTETEKKDIIREQIGKANDKNSTWFDDHYYDDGRRHSIYKADADNGYPLPQLKKDPSNPGKWIDANDRPAAANEKNRFSPYHVVGARDGVSGDHLKALDASAADRKASLELFTAEREYKKNPSPVTEQAVKDAREAFGVDRANNSKISEKFGEDVAEFHAMPENFPDAAKIEDLYKPPNGSRAFDQVWERPDGHYVVVEAKAPDGRLGTREGNGSATLRTKLVKQGTRDYLLTILADMEDRAAQVPRDAELAEKIREALDAGKVDYVKVQAENNLGQYAGYELTHFDIR